jgi:hypothetical protein
MMRSVVATEVPAPTDLRAWGVITRLAVSREFIARVRGGFAPAASSRGSEKPLYRRGPKA